MGERTWIVGGLAAAIFVLGAADARAQEEGKDGIAQIVDSSQPRGAGVDVVTKVGAAIEHAAAKTVAAVEHFVLNEPFGQDRPPAFDVRETFGTVHGKPDPHGALDRKVESEPSARFVGIRAKVTLPHVENAEHPGPRKAVADIYLGGHAKDELDIGLQYVPKRNKDGDVIPHEFGFRVYARNSGIPSPKDNPKVHWWNNSPNATIDKGTWADNARQYFEPGEQVTMEARVTGPRTVEFRVDGDRGHHFFHTFHCIQGFAPGIETSWKRVHAIDETENVHAYRTNVTVTGGHWDEVEILEPHHATTPMTGGAFSVAPNADFVGPNGFDRKNYDAVFGASSGWKGNATGGEPIEIDSSRSGTLRWPQPPPPPKSNKKL